MRKIIEKRIGDLESAGTDWITRLKYIDYLGMSDYDDAGWEEVHDENPITVFRHIESGEIRGVYMDRRTDEQILAEGGSLEYL